MAFYFARISRWLRGGMDKEKEPVSNSSASSTSFSDWGLSVETVKFSLDEGAKMASPRKVKRKRQSREERRIDREFDVVLVPSDGSEFLSESESDDSDWSVGWTEPYGPDFVTDDDDESENSFAVLVACYKRPGCKKVERTNHELLSAIKILPNDCSSGGKNYIEEWLASLQKYEA